MEASAKVKKYLSDKGVGIGHNDTLIAGHAIAMGCIFVTNNTKKFSRVPGLEIEDWAK